MRSLLFVAVCIAIAAPSQAKTPAAPAKAENKTAITHWQEHQTTGPYEWNFVEVDLANPRIRLEAESGLGQLYKSENLVNASKRQAAAGKTVAAAVNADFWAFEEGRPYRPIGMLVSHGILGTTTSRRATLAVLENGTPYARVLSLSVSLSAGSGSFPVSDINTPNDSGTVLWTGLYAGGVTASTTRPVAIIHLDRDGPSPNRSNNGRVERIATAGTLKTSPDRVLISGSKVAQLQPREKVSIDVRVPELPGPIVESVGGGPLVVVDGRATGEEQRRIETMGKDFWNTRHPRTVVGISKDRKRLLLATVDGRQPGFSIGQGLTLVGQQMLKWGAYEALNLDGGGSTTMVVNGELVNRPSGSTMRPVANMLQVIRSGPPQPPSQISLVPQDTVLVPAGTTLNLAVEAHDADGIRVAVKPDQYKVTLPPGAKGTRAPSSKGLNLQVALPENEIDSTITVATAGCVESIDVRTTSRFDFSVVPHALLLDAGERQELKLVARQPAGLLLQPSMATLSSNDRAVSVTSLMAEGVSTGAATIQLRLGGQERQIPVVVGRAGTFELEGFDHEPVNALAGRSFTSTSTVTLTDTGRPGGNDKSWILSYEMTKGGASIIDIPLSATLTKAPIRFSLWVYGNGKRPWVRGQFMDADKELWTADFTNGDLGVNWKDSWKRVTVPYERLIPNNPALSTPKLPVQLQSITTRQDQEATKHHGVLKFDDFTADYLPGDAPAPQAAAGGKISL